jgi:RNA polymerase sigma-70 factor, ECF subfamily
VDQFSETSANRQPATDDELVAAAQLALPAFEDLYRRYVNEVYRFCYRRLGTEADAADATSVVFTRALINIKQCQPHSFRPWLFAISRNIVADHYRQAHPAGSLDGVEIEDHAVGPEELAIAGEERRSLAAVLGRLTDEQRSIIELRLSGLNANEIAAALGKSRNAVDQMQFRAVNRLRSLLATPELQLEETQA